jgi:hypothetical protein
MRCPRRCGCARSPGGWRRASATSAPNPGRGRRSPTSTSRSRGGARSRPARRSDAPAGPQVVAPGPDLTRPAASARRMVGRALPDRRHRDGHHHHLRAVVVGTQPDRRPLPVGVITPWIAASGRTVAATRSTPPQQTYADGAQRAREQDPGQKHHQHLRGLPSTSRHVRRGRRPPPWLAVPGLGPVRPATRADSVHGAPVHGPWSRHGDGMEREPHGPLQPRPSTARKPVSGETGHFTAITYSLHYHLIGERLESQHTPRNAVVRGRDRAHAHVGGRSTGRLSRWRA